MGLRVVDYWPVRLAAERLAWLPYARIKGTNLYYELHYAPTLRGCETLLGFTKIDIEPVPGAPRHGILLEPKSLDIKHLLEECEKSARGGKGARWRIYLGRQPATLFRIASVLRERILIPTPPPSLRFTVEGLDKELARQLLDDLRKIIPSEPVIDGLYLRPVTCRDGVLVDAARLNDGHERLLARYGRGLCATSRT